MKKNLFTTFLIGVSILASSKTTAQWTKTILPNPPGVHGALPGRVISLESGSSNFYAGTLGGNLYMTVDNGANWSYIDSGMTTSDINSILWFKNKLFVGTYGNGIFTTSNNGKTWKQSGASLTNRYVYSFAVIDSILFVGTWDGGVFLSSDNGTTWQQVDNGLHNLNIHCLWVNNKRLFAGTWGDGIYYSDDMASSWTQSNSGIDNLNIYSIVGYGSNVYVGNDYGVYQSLNNGLSWKLINSGLFNTFIRSFIIIQPNLLVGTAGGGVFVSTNSGISWTTFNNGLIDGYIYCLAVNGSKIFAGASNGEIWSRNVSEIITDVEKDPHSIIANDYKLDQNYPNPFNPSTYISYELTQSGFVTLKIFDVAGRNIQTLVNEYQNSGKHTIRFDAFNLSSGIYFYRINTGSFSLTRKMILLK